MHSGATGHDADSGRCGYVRIQITPATPPTAIQAALRKSDSPATLGWIVDLRNSRGGNTWPALAGIGSLLGDGITGFFVDGANHATPWGYTSGAAWLEKPDQDLAFAHKLSVTNARVAVLTDIGVGNEEGYSDEDGGTGHSKAVACHGCLPPKKSSGPGRAGRYAGQRQGAQGT